MMPGAISRAMFFNFLKLKNKGGREQAEEKNSLSEEILHGYEEKARGLSNCEDLLLGVEAACADTRTLFGYTLPCLQGAEVVEPEGECPALQRAHRIDGAPVLVKEAPPGLILPDAVAVLKRVHTSLDEDFPGYVHEPCNPCDLLFLDIDDAGLPVAAGAAPPARKAYAVVEEIRPILQSPDEDLIGQ
jgi:hypothetical protein